MRKSRWLRASLIIVAIVVGWHVFEFAWDRRLFGVSAEHEVTNVGAREAIRLLAEDEELQIIDVRPIGSFMANHLPGAVNARYSRGEIEEKVLAELNRSSPVLVYCDGGFRSRMSLRAMKAEGFETIYHLHRGILSWRLRGGACEEGDE